MSFISIRRIRLWCQIMKGKEITMWIDVCLIEKWTLILKNYGKGRFSYETKASMPFIPMRRMSLWCSIMKRKGITIWICVYPNREMNFNSKKRWKEKLFLWNQSINVIDPNDQNEFMVLNHERRGDYYVILSTSSLINKLWSSEMMWRKAF